MAAFDWVTFELATVRICGNEPQTCLELQQRLLCESQTPFDRCRMLEFARPIVFVRHRLTFACSIALFILHLESQFSHSVRPEFPMVAFVYFAFQPLLYHSAAKAQMSDFHV